MFAPLYLLSRTLDKSCTVCYWISLPSTECKCKLENTVTPSQFNSLSSQYQWGKPALRHHFYNGLPSRLKDDITKGNRKPWTLSELRQKARNTDARYLEQQQEHTQEQAHKLSKNLNSNLSHLHHLPDHLINLDPLTTNLQTANPALVQLNQLLLKSRNWQVNLTQRENSLPKSINIMLLITCVCIAALVVIKPLTALTPKQLKQKLHLPLSPDPSLRIWPWNRKKAEQSTDINMRGGLQERLCRGFTNCVLECSGLSYIKFIIFNPVY